jgi:transposase
MTEQAIIPAAFVGIDWAAQKHDICVHSPDGTVLSRQIVEAKPAALQDWILALRERFTGQGAKIFVCLEQSKGALIYQLMEYDFFVLYPINPKTLSSFRDAFRPSGAKSDPSDADLLAEIVRLHRHRLQAWTPDDEQTRKLAAYCRKRRKAVEMRTRTVQQLQAELKTYFPLALDFIEPGTLLACDFLKRWPTLARLRKTKPQTIRKFFYARNCRRIDELNAVLERLPTALEVTSDPAIIEPAADNAQMLAASLRPIILAVEEFDQKIETLFKAHPDAPIFQSFPGSGAQLGPRLLTAFGSDRRRLDSAERMSVISGIAPVQMSSGQSSIVSKRWACPKFMRQSFHEFARCSIAHCSWAKAYYDEQIKKNKRHHTAVRSLAFKWIRVLFACWKARTPYNDAFYNQKLQQAGSAYACA